MEKSIIPLPTCCARAVLLAKERLESQGHKLVELEPLPLDDIITTVWGMLGAKKRVDNKGEKIMDHYMPMVKAALTPKFLKKMLYSWYKRQGRHGEMYAASIGNHVSTAVDFQESYMKLERYRKDFAKKWREAGISALVWPGFGPAWPHDSHPEIAAICALNFLFNHLDYPACYVPVTTVQEDEQVYNEKTSERISKAMKKVMAGSAGLSIGVSIIARPYQEERCLNVARQVFNE